MSRFNLVPKPDARYNNEVIKDIIVGYDNQLQHYFIDIWGVNFDEPLYWKALGTPRAKMMEMIEEFVDARPGVNHVLPFIKKQLALDLRFDY